MRNLSAHKSPTGGFLFGDRYKSFFFYENQNYVVYVYTYQVISTGVHTYVVFCLVGSDGLMLPSINWVEASSIGDGKRGSRLWPKRWFLLSGFGLFDDEIGVRVIFSKFVVGSSYAITRAKKVN